MTAKDAPSAGREAKAARLATNTASMAQIASRYTQRGDSGRLVAATSDDDAVSNEAARGWQSTEGAPLYVAIRKEHANASTSCRLRA